MIALLLSCLSLTLQGQTVSSDNLRTANASYEAKRMYKAQLENCEQENDSLRSATANYKQAGSEKDSAIVSGKRIQELQGGQIKSLGSEVKKYRIRCAWVGAVAIAEGIAIYVLIFK